MNTRFLKETNSFEFQNANNHNKNNTSKQNYPKSKNPTMTNKVNRINQDVYNFI